MLVGQSIDKVESKLRTLHATALRISAPYPFVAGNNSRDHRPVAVRNATGRSMFEFECGK